MPRTRNSMARSVLPRPGRAADEGRAAPGEAALRDLVQPAKSRSGHFGKDRVALGRLPVARHVRFSLGHSQAGMTACSAGLVGLIENYCPRGTWCQVQNRRDARPMLSVATPRPAGNASAVTEPPPPSVPIRHTLRGDAVWASRKRLSPATPDPFRTPDLSGHRPVQRPSAWARRSRSAAIPWGLARAPLNPCRTGSTMTGSSA